MKKKNKYLKGLLVPTFYSLFFFMLTVILTYLFTIEYKVNFEIGFPLRFYYQIGVDCDVQFGTNIPNFFIDIALIWILCTILWFLHRKRRNR